MHLTKKKVDHRIEGFAYDCTIGCGKGMDDQNEPQSDELEALARILGREPTNDEVNALCDHWRENQAMMENP